MISRRSYILIWTLGIGIPFALALWALVPTLQPNMGQFLYWPGAWYQRAGLLLVTVALSLGIGYAFGRARWAGRQR